MKYIKTAILSAIFTVLCLSASWAGYWPPSSFMFPVGSSIQSIGSKPFLFPVYTVATLPTLGAADVGAIVQVSDGADSTDTTVGGGTTYVLARWDGAAWVNAGDGTSSAVGSGSVTTVKNKGVQIGGADQVTLDFGVGFTVTESPDTESNIDLDVTPDDVVPTLKLTGGGVEVKYDSTLTKGRKRPWDCRKRR